MAAMIEDTSSPLALALSLADLYAGSVNEPFTLAVANQNSRLKARAMRDSRCS